MESKTQTQILNELFTKYNLVYDQENKKDSDVFISKNFKIITRPGIQKIQAALDIEASYDVVFIDPFSMVIKGSFSYEDKELGKIVSTQTFGEASVDRNENFVITMSSKTPDGKEFSQQEVQAISLVKGNVSGNPPYLAAMAEKRALSRGVLQLAGLYKHGVFGEDEADDFKADVKRQRAE